MNKFNQSVEELILRRFSCRKFNPERIGEAELALLKEKMESVRTEAPFGSAIRFEIRAARPENTEELKGLGTYGLIKDPPGFIIGAVAKGKHALLDYGYVFQVLLLHATEMNLGTCWLGGNFSRSSFSERICLRDDEMLPAVSPFGWPAENIRATDPLRKVVHSDQRMGWERIFFDSEFSIPLTAESAGKFAPALEMLRLAPSAKNKQPWRVLKTKEAFHFYLHRSNKGVLDKVVSVVLQMEDLEQIDIGIAMSHFGLMLDELNIRGKWVDEPQDKINGEGLEYVCSWVFES